MVTAGTVSLTINSPYGTPNGIQWPPLTTDPTGPTAGQTYWNSTNNTLREYFPSGWQNLPSIFGISGFPSVTITTNGGPGGDGGDYGPNTVGTTTNGFQEATNYAVTNQKPLVMIGALSVPSPINVSGDITVFAYGATLKNTNTIATNPMFYNSAEINLVWLGGMIDQNKIATNGAFAFGATTAVYSGCGKRMLSCFAQDIRFINANGSSWTANMVDNTGAGTHYNIHVRWKNLFVSSDSASDNSDMFELVGEDCIAEVIGFPNCRGAAVITSAWLKNSSLQSYICDINGLPISGANISSIVLQPYTGNGTFPNFSFVRLRGNGQILLNNGNLSSPTNSGQDITIDSDGAANIQLGNSAYDIWTRLTINGKIQPTANNGLTFGQVDGVVLYI